MKKRIIWLLSAVLLVGCSNSNGFPNEELIDSASEITSDLTKDVVEEVVEELTEKPKTTVVNKLWEKYPLYADGKEIGWFRVNRVEKLRFVDVNNEKAKLASVKCCYSVNVTVRTKTDNPVEVLTFNPEMTKSGKVVSSIANIGWSGFSDDVTFYNGKGQGSLEVAVQPEVRGVLNMNLEFSDQNDREYAPVKISKQLIKKAKVGPKLRNKGETVSIKSISGAVFDITPKKSYFANHVYGNRRVSDFCDVMYLLETKKAPNGKRTVGTVEGKGNYAKLMNSWRLGVQFPKSSIILYDQTNDAKKRVRKGNEEAWKFYVSSKKSFEFGKKYTVWTNRDLSSLAGSLPEFVRLRFEFPDEMKARSLKEKLNFNGRYVVYEVGTPKH